MQTRRPVLGLAFLVVALGLIALLGLALTNTTWAAPGAQGTVPPPVVPSPTPTEPPPEGDGDGIPPPPGVPSVSCTLPELGGLCVTAGKTISVPVGAVLTGTVLSITGTYPQPPCPASPSGQIFLDHCFQVSWTQADGTPVTTFAAPVEDCMTYSASDVAIAGGNAGNLLIGFVHAPGTWTMVKPVVDAGNSRVCALVGQPFSWQALFAPQPTLLPVTGAGSGGEGWALAGLVGLALAGGLLAFRVRKSAA